LKIAERIRIVLLTLSVGLASLALTTWLWQHEQRSLEANLRADFDFSVRQTTSRVEQRIAAYEQILRATRGLFDASDRVEERDFQRFVNTLANGSEFAGLQAMVFTRSPTAVSPADAVAALRVGSKPDLPLQASADLNGVAPITYVAPDTPINRQVLGRNLFANPLRRDTMLQARDSGDIAITPRIDLLMDDPASQPAFAIYMAIYAQGQPVDTPAARRASLRGWVHVAFRLHDLMASLYGESTPGIALRIYDGIRTEPDNLMFDSHPETDAPTPLFQATEYISFPQHAWTLQIRSTAAFERRHERDSARIIAFAGASVGLLLALLTWQLATGRARAYKHARRMTRELRDSEERMRHMAQHDALTQLPNRALFADRLNAALALARRDKTRASLMFVDLDRFKPVNDVYGHAIGDRLLVAAAARMRECLRESDTLARMGGDEFVVLLPHIETDHDAERVAERIRTALARPFLIDTHTLLISASIGIGIFPDDGNDHESLIKSADDAMYRAKDSGRDQLIFASGP